MSEEHRDWKEELRSKIDKHLHEHKPIDIDELYGVEREIPSVTIVAEHRGDYWAVGVVDLVDATVYEGTLSDGLRSLADVFDAADVAIGREREGNID